ncbi:MAG: helix-turn-helix domain-containing protein [Acidovorax sp.]|nr:helix-turn-helix domain-containing protein [Acidovorax sp.]
MDFNPDSVMTVKEVADYLRVNQRTVYRLVVGRKLPGFKVGTTWRFKRAVIDAWIAAQTAAADHEAETEAENRGEEKNA